MTGRVVIDILGHDDEHITFSNGSWLYQHSKEYRKRDMKRIKRIHANALRYDQCQMQEQNLATVALHIQVMSGDHREFFNDIDEVTEEWKNEYLWFIDMPGDMRPRILVSNDHKFVKTKLKQAVNMYIDEIRMGERDWWSGRVLDNGEDGKD